MTVMDGVDAKQAVVLFGHGARDPRWAEPFHALLGKVRSKFHGTHTSVHLAFLEFMAPELNALIDELAEKGIERITVVPVFFGQGGHLRNDFPVLMQNAREKHPQVRIEATPPVGEWVPVLDSIAEQLVRESAGSLS